uniref:Uncharacterized protein n=1 Tax=Arundo donax TaxID=35708 RepID=A0A0A9ENE9_ARUDO
MLFNTGGEDRYTSFPAKCHHQYKQNLGPT